MVELEPGRLFRSAPTTTTKTTTGVFVGSVSVYALLWSPQAQQIAVATYSTGDGAPKHDRLSRYIDRMPDGACRRVEVRPRQGLRFDEYGCSVQVQYRMLAWDEGLVDGWMDG